MMFHCLGLDFFTQNDCVSSDHLLTKFTALFFLKAQLYSIV